MGDQLDAVLACVTEDCSIDVVAGQQIDGGEDIRAVNEDTTDNGRKDQHVGELAPARVVDEIIHVDKVELVVLDLFSLPLCSHDLFFFCVFQGYYVREEESR